MIFATSLILSVLTANQRSDVVLDSGSANTTGLVVHPIDSESETFMPWQSDRTINLAILELRKAGGGKIVWLPGEYEIPQPIEVWDGKDILIEGLPGTRLVFPPEPDNHAVLTEDLVEGTTHIEVDNPELVRLHWRYQLYSADGKGGRLQEFRVTGIEGNRLKIHPAIRFMKHVKAVPKGSMLLTRVNFIEFHRSENITLRGLTMDGGSRGFVEGHTTYCGVLAAGKTSKDKRPASQGLSIQNCTFKNFKGRGVAIYNTSGVSIQDCHFRNIATQALEIDHYSSGLVTRNLVEDSVAGITLNDAFDTSVTFNTIRNCRHSVTFFKHFKQEWVNTNNDISFNYIAPLQGRPAIQFRHPMVGNRVERNTFQNCPEELWVKGASGNKLLGNRAIAQEE